VEEVEKKKGQEGGNTCRKRKVKASFKDGSTMVFDYLIGADGANSAVRSSRASGMHYRDMGFTNIAGASPMSSASPELLESVATGPCRWLGKDGHAMLILKYHAGEFWGNRGG